MGCSVMSVSHSSFGAAAVNRRWTRSSQVGAFLRFLTPFPRPGQALEAELAHDLPHQLLVDDQALFDLQGGSDPQHPVGAPGAGVDVGDRRRPTAHGGSRGRSAGGT